MIKLPSSLCKKWSIEEGIYLFAEICDKKVLLFKEMRKTTIQSILIDAEARIILPKPIIDIVGFRVGQSVSLILDKNVLSLKNSKIIPMHSPENKAEKLMEKLERELDASKKNPIGVRYHALLNDICMFIILNNWDDVVIESLLEKPHPLKDLLHALRADGEFDEFFEQKMRELTLSYIVT